MDRLPVIPWTAILPVKDADGRIYDWRATGTFQAPDAIAALTVARSRYGQEADVIRVKSL